MVLKSTYRGFVAPVFAPFDTTGELNLSEVPKYAQYLRSKNVDAVLVNGSVGEGALMSNCERKKLTEAWMDAAKDTSQRVMVHVGGTNLNNVIELDFQYATNASRVTVSNLYLYNYEHVEVDVTELSKAKHAETIGAWSILCLPELYFRPKNIDELIDYLKIVGAAAPNTPLFYYHYPQLTGVTLDMTKFLDKAYSEIPTISGLKYTHNNLDEGTRCVQLRGGIFAIFLGSDQLLSAALCMGFDCMILTVINFAAEEVHKIKEYVYSGDIHNAQRIQNRIRHLTEYVESEMEWINGFKAIITMVTKLNLGAPRPPLKAITSDQFSKLRTFLKHPNCNWLQN